MRNPKAFRKTVFRKEVLSHSAKRTHKYPNKIDFNDTRLIKFARSLLYWDDELSKAILCSPFDMESHTTTHKINERTTSETSFRTSCICSR